VAVVFGIDAPEHERWGLEACPRSFAYASDRGRRLLWPITPAKRAADLTRRTVTFDAARATIVFAREVLAGRAARIIATDPPDLVVVLGHGQPTKRWLGPYRAMDALAPTLVVHQEIPVWRPLQIPPPRGWSMHTSSGPVSVVSYRREADGAMVRAVGN
jgi:hypothetical protein